MSSKTNNLKKQKKNLEWQKNKHIFHTLKSHMIQNGIINSMKYVVYNSDAHKVLKYWDQCCKHEAKTKNITYRCYRTKNFNKDNFTALLNN